MNLRFNKIILILIGISIALTLVWSRSGLIIATGESGIPFYNASGNANYYKYSWTEGAIGHPTYFAVTAYYFLYLISLGEKIGISPTVMQSFFFLCILLTSSLGMYFLIKHLHERSEKKVKGFNLLYGITPLMYILNLFALVNIWNRFQYTFMFFYAFLPLGMYLYIKGLHTKKIRYSIYLNLVGLIFTIALSSIPLVQLFWGVVFLYTLYYTIRFLKNKNELLFIAKYLITNLIVWLLCNTWWLVQFFVSLKNSPYITSIAYNPAGNVETLISLSHRLGNMSYLFRLMHKEFFENIQSIWGTIYNNPLMTILSFAPAFLAFIPLLMKKKPGYIYFFSGLALLTLFLSKGVADPLGFIFYQSFIHIRALEAFRNPYEKFGLLIPFTFAPLIGYSFQVLVEKYKHQYSQTKINISLGLAVVLLMGILVFPFWNRWVFSSPENPANNLKIGDYTQIPQSYQQANNYLNSDKQDFRSIALPMSGEGITYKWKYGYSGVELSNGLFDKPFISFTTSLPYYEPITYEVERVLNYHPSHLHNMMQILNTKYIMLRNDIDFKKRNLSSPDAITSKLNNIKEISLDKTFDKLSFYKINDQYFLPKIYASNSVHLTDKEEPYLYSKVIPYTSYNKNDIYVSSELLQAQIPSEQIKSYIYIPTPDERRSKLTKEATEYLKIPRPTVFPDNALLELPHISILPDDIRYPLIQLREWLAKDGNNWSDQNYTRLRESGKRLAEIFYLVEKNASEDIIKKTAQRYKNTVLSLDLGYIFYFDGVKGELVRHQHILNKLSEKQLIEKYEDLKEIQVFISDLFDKGIPVNPSLNVSYTNRTYTLNLPETANYQIVTDIFRTNQNPVSSNSAIARINNTHEELQFNKTKQLSLNQGKNIIAFEDDQSKITGKYVPLERSLLAVRNNVGHVKHPLPNITFNKVNSSTYDVTVKNAVNPFILVFSEAYHVLWQAKIQNEIIAEKNHLLTNGFANGWYIEENGDFTIQLRYTGEDIFDTGKIISTISVFVLVIILTGYLIYKKVIKNK